MSVIDYTKLSTLVHRPEPGKDPWALVSHSGKALQRWPAKPTPEEVAKAEARVNWFKHNKQAEVALPQGPSLLSLSPQEIMAWHIARLKHLAPDVYGLDPGEGPNVEASTLKSM